MSKSRVTPPVCVFISSVHRVYLSRRADKMRVSGALMLLGATMGHAFIPSSIIKSGAFHLRASDTAVPQVMYSSIILALVAH